jgi:hypothetical protein
MLPQGETVYEDLSSDFVETEDFLSDLADSEVTGYLSFEGDGGHGFALVEDGEPRTIKLFENGDERVLEGRSGIVDLFDRGSYTVDVVDCDESGREIVKIKVSNEEFKSGIDTGDIDLRNFLATNVTDQDNDCHLMMVDETTTAIVTFVEGLPVQAKYSTPEEILVGAEALDRILDYLQEHDTEVDIYKLTEKEVEEEVGEKEEVIGEHVEDELQDLSSTFEEKADDLLDEMGMDFMGDDGGGGGGDVGDVTADAGDGMGGDAAEESDDGLGGLGDDGADDDVDELLDEMGVEEDDEEEPAMEDDGDDGVDELLDDMGIESDE